MTTLAPIFLPVTHYNSTPAKCVGKIVPVNNGLSQIVTSYLGTECTKPSHYLLQRYSTFQNMIVTVTKQNNDFVPSSACL
jgi:hypothetical protein